MKDKIIKTKEQWKKQFSPEAKSQAHSDKTENVARRYRSCA